MLLAFTLVSSASLAAQIGTIETLEAIQSIEISKKGKGDSYMVVINIMSESAILIDSNLSYADASALAADISNPKTTTFCDMTIYPGRATDRLCSISSVVGLE